LLGAHARQALPGSSGEAAVLFIETYVREDHDSGSSAS
jgi:hypothetical protein